MAKTLWHSEWPKLYGTQNGQNSGGLAILSAIGLKCHICVMRFGNEHHPSLAKFQKGIVIL